MPLVRKGSPEPPREPNDRAADGFSALVAGTPDERWRAARVLADVPGGIAALAAALPDESDARVREAIFTSLARAATPESVAAILPSIRSQDASVRTAALDALRAMPDAVGPSLPALLADPDPDVRLLSCEIARGLPSGEATRLMCRLLEDEAEPNVCAAAIDVLADIGEASARPALERCAARFAGEPFLVFAARAAIERVGSSRNARG